MNLKFLTVLLAFFLCGCVGVNPNSLQRATIEETLVLKQDFSWKHHSSISGNTSVYTVKAGDYTAKYQSSEGTYYEGPSHCWQWERIEVNDKPSVEGISGYNCGMLVPKAATDNIKIYHFLTDTIFIPRVGDSNQPVPGKDPTANTSTSTVPTVVNTVSGTNATALQGGIGGGIAAGIIGVMEESKMKNMQFGFAQPDNSALRAALTKKESN